MTESYSVILVSVQTRSAAAFGQIRQLIIPLAQYHAIRPLDALRHRVVHVAYLVTPRAEATARVDVLALEPRLQGGERGIASLRAASNRPATLGITTAARSATMATVMRTSASEKPRLR